MPSCSVVGCTNRGQGGIRLFVFPRNAERRTLWVTKISGVNFVIKVGGAPLPSFPLPSLPVPIPSLPQPPSPPLEVGPLKSS